MRMYDINKDYFKIIDTEEKAYWLGFIYADGCVTKTGRGYTLRIKLARKDEDTLYKLRECIGSNAPIRRDTLKADKLVTKDFENSTLIICNTEMCNDLIKLGCGERKSLTLKPPTYEQVPKHLVVHFIRGYLDGDGWVSCWNYNRKYKVSNGEIRICNMFSCCVGFCGTKEFLDYICEELKEYGLNKVKYKHKSEIYEMNWGRKNNALKIYHALYDDAHIYMNRKYNKFIEIISCSTKK